MPSVHKVLSPRLGSAEQADEGPTRVEPPIVDEAPQDHVPPHELEYEPKYEPESGNTDLRGRTVRGSVWTLGGYGLQNVLRLASNLILTRLLAPELFGLMLVVNTVMQGLAMFSDVGVGPAIIQNPRGERESFLRTAYSIQASRGVILFLAGCLAGYPFAWFYGIDPLRYLIPVSALSALVDGLASTNLHRLNKHLMVGRLTMLTLGTQVVGIIGMVTWAVVHPSVWALLVPPVAAQVLRCVATHFLLRDRIDRFGWDRDAARQLFSFGIWVFVATLLTFLANTADRLTLPSLIDARTLGVYAVAIYLSATPTQAVLRLGSQVVFPAYSSVANDPVRFGRIYRRVRIMLLMVGGFAVVGLASAGPAMVDVLYDDRYHSAGWMVQILAAGAWFQILEVTNGSALLARGKTVWVAASTAAKLVGFIAFFIAGYSLAGFPGALIGLASADVLRYLASALGTGQLGLHVWGQDLLITLAVAGSAVGIYLVSHGLVGSVAPPWVQFVVAVALTCAMWGPLCWRQWKRSRRL